jgi:hypothetical protein
VELNADGFGEPYTQNRLQVIQWPRRVVGQLDSVAIHFTHYNFVRIRGSFRITPAMAAGVTRKLWSLTDMVEVIEDREALKGGTLVVG